MAREAASLQGNAALNLAVLLEERQRREAIKAVIRKEVARRFVITEDHRDKVRRLQVYKACAAAAKTTLNNEFARHVMDVCAEAGAIPVRPFNRHMFAHMKERETEWQPRKSLSDRDVGKLRRAWYARLAAEGLGGKTGDGEVRPLDSFEAFRADINTAFFEKATADYWRRKSDLEVWGLYALEGISIRDIATRLGLTKWRVESIVTAMRQEMDGHRREGKETKVDAQDEDEGMDDSGGP